MNTKDLVKSGARLVATIAILPAWLSYLVRSAIMGRNRALEGSTQAFALLPGMIGQYARRAFLARTLEYCAPSATIEFGTVFSQVGARVDENAYVGPRSHIGLVHIERDVLIAAGVHIPSGMRTHGTEDPSVPIRDQEPRRDLVRIGAGSWIGSAAVVMADVGRNSVVGAGAVVTHAVPDGVVAAGVPARVIRVRAGAAGEQL